MPETETSTLEAPLRSEAAGIPVGIVDVSVIVVNYNVRDFLEQTLRSVFRASDGLDVEVIVVDNNSIDHSVEMVRSEFPGVRVIANDRNVGFGAANNQAIRESLGRYLFILNPDTIVREDTLRTMVDFMDSRPEAGAVGCKILNPDGTFALESRRAFPTPSVALYRMLGLGRLFPHSPRFGRYNMTHLPIDQVAEVDALSGSCMLVRSASLSLSRKEAENLKALGVDPALAPGDGSGAGLFDEDFFMYGEDLDWCFRIQKSGWKIFYTPDTQIVHYKGECTRKGDLRYVRLFYGAMLQFTQKHLNDRYSKVFALAIRAGIMLRAGLSAVNRAAVRSWLPALDTLVIWLCVAAAGYLRTGEDFVEGLRLYAGVAVGYALLTTASIGFFGGYRTAHRRRVGPVYMGAVLGLLASATLSFFIKDIAFSRLVLGIGFLAAGSLLPAIRVGLYLRRRRTERNAIFVGPADEAERLQRMLSGHLRPPFRLMGYVSDGAPQAPTFVEHLGGTGKLRDLARLKGADEIVFAGEGISKDVTFRLMQHLRDLDLHFRILAEGRDHVIGKASVQELGAPMLEAAGSRGALRSPVQRRLFEIMIAIAGLLILPAVAAIASVGTAVHAASVSRKIRGLTKVLSGDLALIGLDPADDSEELRSLGLRPGLVTIPEALPSTSRSKEERLGAYAFYVRNQSAGLDREILLRALRNLPH
jgi:O-antigen biosynthesis protein